MKKFSVRLLNHHSSSTSISEIMVSVVRKLHLFPQIVIFSYGDQFQ
uniref:Uncharacterized protein n=1 Tax=Rhizophora mucronata TaxID=61149 RepID=A0A2P2QE20_RHIMU